MAPSLLKHLSASGRIAIGLVMTDCLLRRDRHDLYQMQRAHGRRSFTGYARKLSAEVDAGTPVSDLRQYRRPLDSLSSRGSASSKSQPARGAVVENGRPAGPSSLAGEWSRRLGRWVSDGPSAKLKQAIDQGLPVIREATQKYDLSHPDESHRAIDVH